MLLGNGSFKAAVNVGSAAGGSLVFSAIQELKKRIVMVYF